MGLCEEERGQRLILYLICLVADLNRTLFKWENTAQSPLHNGSLSSTWCPIAQMHYEVALSWPLFQCDMGSRALHFPHLLSEHTNNNLSFSHFRDVCNREEMIVCFVLSWNNMESEVYVPNISLCTNGKIGFPQRLVRCSSFVVLDSFGLRKSHVHVIYMSEL